jgi:hypothetical protein
MEKEEIKAYAREVAKRLGEQVDKPLRQLELLIEHAGREFVDEQVAEALKIEENGGLLTEDKSRRRTTGGVFFYTAKAKLAPEVRGLIFPGFGQKQRGKVVEWEQRLDYVKPLLDEGEHGEMRYINIILNGRPGKVVIEDNSVITTIAHTHNNTPFPRGVPRPPDITTLYTVYMTNTHWEAVQESLEQYKNDRLIVEGSAVFDKDTESVAVFAMRVTSHRMEKMARQEDTQEAKSEKQDKKDQKDQKSDKQKRQKHPKQQQQHKPMTAKPLRVPDPPKPTVEYDIPDGVPPDVADKLKQLYSAAETLRDRIDTM